MENKNPFKAIEPDAQCPVHLREELISEIDLIRNSLQVVEVYAYDIFAAFTTFLTGLTPHDELRS
ncbi:hypothetical protein HNV11_01320 [Spirosoma taeanense]|uniref:Uncharacterized protein n=1 Tax=Spirosoma taeanense TaxID=2735870 RepID=A0A6M5Y4J0_9BACT|nr:hypothetical protein [Spirosoma taeanense]QJW88111.1 hypothetical protein HNV11_01320 [Spirosoma taeanense]